MKCPNCEREMKNKSRWVQCISIAFWDEDYPMCEWYEEFWCWHCRIKYEEGKWTIPKKYERPTNKQIKTIKFINNTLNLTEEPILKNQCWKFINKYFEKAKLKANKGGTIH